MTCLNLEKLYAYLEGDLDGRDKKFVEDHAASCSACREALEERRYLLQAAETLPAFEVPGDFARSVMDRIAPERAKAKTSVWLKAAAAGAATFAAALVATTLITGHTLSQLVLGLNRFLWSNLQGLASVLTKGAKYVFLTFKTLLQITGEVLQILKTLTSFIGPETQIVFIGATVVLVLGGGFLWSRRFSVERNHEE
jgi:hypothetical protein